MNRRATFDESTYRPPLDKGVFGSGTWVTPFGDMGNTFMGCCLSDAGYKRSPIETKTLNRVTSTGA